MSTSLASSLQLKRAETWSPESLMHTSSSVRQKHRKVTTVITVQWSCRSLMILFLSSLMFKMVIKICYIIKYMLYIIKIKRLTLQIIWQLMAWVRIHVTLIIINHQSSLTQCANVWFFPLVCFYSDHCQSNWTETQCDNHRSFGIWDCKLLSKSWSVLLTQVK